MQLANLIHHAHIRHVTGHAVECDIGVVVELRLFFHQFDRPFHSVDELAPVESSRLRNDQFGAGGTHGFVQGPVVLFLEDVCKGYTVNLVFAFLLHNADER